MNAVNDLAFTLPDKTPFHMEDCWESRLENKNHNCTHSEIDTLILKHIVGPVDLAIMRTLATYKYLNAYNIQCFLNDLSPLQEFYKKGYYSCNLKKLVKAGILARYHYIRFENGLPEGASPLRFYDLTPGAYSYISPVTTAAYPLQTCVSDVRKLELLALNQFLIRMQSTYPGIRIYHYLTWKKDKAKAFCIDAAIRCPVPAGFHSEEKSISIFPLPVRFSPRWQEDAAAKLRSINTWLGKTKVQHPLPLPIFLCESLNMGEQLFHYFCSMDDLRYLPFYFITDGSALSHPLWDCLFSCHLSEESEDTVIIRHHL